MICTHDNLRYYKSRSIKVPHGMFTSSGGVSRDRFSSLNLSYNVGDSRKHVQTNRNSVKEALGLAHLVSVGQTHGDSILVVYSSEHPPEQRGYDAMITDRKGTGLLIQQADCQAVLLHDPATECIAAIHNGWRGSVLNIIGKTVEKMKEVFGAQAVMIRAIISPSLGPCCAEFIHYRNELPTWMHDYQVTANHFDFWSISREQLTASGLQAEHIETVGRCTLCNPEFFSYRLMVREGKETVGRNGSVIGLPQVSGNLKVAEQGRMV